MPPEWSSDSGGMREYTPGPPRGYKMATLPADYSYQYILLLPLTTQWFIQNELQVGLALSL